MPMHIRSTIGMGDLATYNIRQEKDYEPKKIDALYGDGSHSQTFSVLISIQSAFSEEEVYENDDEKEVKMK